MALKTVSQLRDSVAGMLSGLDLNNVDDLNGALERAARNLMIKADVPEASNTQNIVLYQGVFDYVCDARIFGTAVNDIRPQGVTRNLIDYPYKTFGVDFDRTKGLLPNGTMFTFEYFNGIPIIRIASKIPLPQIILDQMNDTTGWVAASTASNLVQDRAVYYQSPASLRFTLTGSGSGTLTKTLTNSVDISSYQGVGVAFVALRIPDGATVDDLTEISLVLGSDASNYDRVGATEGFLGTWVAGNWLLVAFDFSTATTTGTPDWSATQYIQVLFSHTGTFTNIRVGGLWIAQPSPAEIQYQTAAIFIPSGSTTPQTTITATTDTIILNDSAYTLYEQEAVLAVLQNSGSGKGDPTREMIKNELNGNEVSTFGLYGKYRGDNPSQELRTIGNYYDDSSLR